MINSDVINSLEINGDTGPKIRLVDFLESIDVLGDVVNSYKVDFSDTLDASVVFSEYIRTLLDNQIGFQVIGQHHNAFSGGYAGAYLEEISVSELYKWFLGLSTLEDVRAEGVVTTKVAFVFSIVSGMNFTGKHDLSFIADFTEVIDADDSGSTLTRESVMSFVEALVAAGSADTILHGMYALSEAIAVTEQLSPGIGAKFLESVLQINDDSSLAMGAQFLESIAATGQHDILFRASMPLSESLALTAIHSTGLDAVFAEALGVDAVAYAGFVATFAEALNTIADSDSLNHANLSLIESLEAVDFPGLGFNANFDAAMGIDADSILGIVASFVESINPDDSFDFLLHANLPISEAIALTALHKVGLDATLTESVIVGDDIVFDSRLILAILESMVFGETAEMSARILFPISEILNETAEVSSQAAMHMALAEGIEFGGVLNTPEGVFDAWVVNAETKAPWMYDNFPFNSFTYADGKYLALSDVGLYELSGDTDDGAQIDAILKTGLMDFGTALQKSNPVAYFGYTSDGRLLFKTITTATGQKIERWYELKARTADATREARVKMARGVKSVYWQYVIENIEGADFDIDSVKLLPSILKRRI